MTLLVQGGPANSGRKLPMREKPTSSWECDCAAHDEGSALKKTNPPYLASCSTCRKKRP